MVSFSGTPTVAWRRTGEICLVGPEFCMLTGWEKEELTGKRKYIYEVRIFLHSFPVCPPRVNHSRVASPLQRRRILSLIEISRSSSSRTNQWLSTGRTLRIMHLRTQHSRSIPIVCSSSLMVPLCHVLSASRFGEISWTYLVSSLVRSVVVDSKRYMRSHLCSFVKVNGYHYYSLRPPMKLVLSNQLHRVYSLGDFLLQHCVHNIYRCYRLIRFPSFISISLACFPWASPVINYFTIMYPEMKGGRRDNFTVQPVYCLKVTMCLMFLECMFGFECLGHGYSKSWHN